MWDSLREGKEPDKGLWGETGGRGQTRKKISGLIQYRCIMKPIILYINVNNGQKTPGELNRQQTNE